ncbi:MAG: aspartate-semialdehyde dehydrogenase [Desulfobacteraceae bacterium]|nr:MAG: aspartate-semialdehyde dehydrogenase [Desulfobacteraceae bacterium]
MLKIAFVGWRGMVGSVLMQRMLEEHDFKGFEPVFFSTSNVGAPGPQIGLPVPSLKDAYDIKTLSSFDMVVTCQGGSYTEKVYPELRKAGFKGYWVDAASTLRMHKESIIVLDPVNRKVIDVGLKTGVKDYIGGNCTVSLMLMALNGLFESTEIEWISTMTYQAASGAGANNMKELAAQMMALGDVSRDLLNNPSATALEIDQAVTAELRRPGHPIENFGAPLAANLLAWIDRAVEMGQTREEWKGLVETNKILDLKKTVPVDGLCVRVGAMRCHSQGLTIKLKKDIPLDELVAMIAKGNAWVKVVPNNKEVTIRDLTPAAVSGTLTVPIGRIHKMVMGPEFLTAFTCGDQLLWGAAEPIRRILKIILEHHS